MSIERRIKSAKHFAKGVVDVLKVPLSPRKNYKRLMDTINDYNERKNNALKLMRNNPDTVDSGPIQDDHMYAVGNFAAIMPGIPLVGAGITSVVIKAAPYV